MKKYIFDLDGTLLDTNSGDYVNAEVIKKNVDILRELFEHNIIVIQTARGKHWYKFTEEQLKYFKIPYHILSVGEKIHGDVYVDDKAINSNDFFK